MASSNSRQQWDDLQQMLKEWDPIRLIEMGAPPSEYESLAAPILRSLIEGKSAQEISAQIANELQSNFGVSPPSNLDAFVENVVAWFREYKNN
jgi:hypothetical protein